MINKYPENIKKLFNMNTIDLILDTIFLKKKFQMCKLNPRHFKKEKAKFKI